MCRPRAGEANQLFSVYIALWRPTALAIIYNVVGRQRNLGLVNCRNWKWDFELSQIKWDKNWNDNREIIEVPVYENPRRQALNTGLNSLCKMSEIHEIGGVRHQIYQRIILCGQLAGINLDSWTVDKLLFTNLLFLASELEVAMINKKISFLQARKFKKWLNLKENNKTICILADEKLCGNKQ